MNTKVQEPDSRSLGRVWAVSWRVAVVGFGAWFTAVIVNDTVGAGGNTRINIATSGVAAGTLIAFFADFAALYQGCIKYLQGLADTLMDLSKAFWKGWVSLTLIFLSYFAWRSDASNPDPWMIVYSNRGLSGPTTEHRISTIPALFKDDASPDWTKGVAFDEKELDVSISAFNRILSAYAACGSVRDKPRVELTIAGYASSKQFDNYMVKESNRMNVEAANRRAWNAYCFTAGSVPVHLVNPEDWVDAKWSCAEVLPVPEASSVAINVRVQHWADSPEGFGDMMKARPIQDWPKGIGKIERQYSEELDRRVDFYLNHAGACQVEQAQSPTTLAANSSQLK